jgi:cytochrome c oxidase assembly protein subunit 16
MTFQSRKYRSAADLNTFGARYRAMMAKHPFLLFGLPFMSVIVGASFVLTPATAIRYERHDRKVRQMTRDEELGVGKAGRKVDIREEYFVCLFFFFACDFSFWIGGRGCANQLADWFASRVVGCVCCGDCAGQFADVLCFPPEQRLAAKDNDNWEQKRVKRLKGETDGIL